MKKVKKEHEKVSLKLHIQKTKIMGSGPIALWQIVGEDSMDISLSKHRELVKDREAWCATVHGITKSQT